MDELNRIGISRRARTLRLLVVGCLVSTTLLLCFPCAMLHAAPITLRFEAVVGPPRQGFDAPLPPSWNLALQEGDVISGTFTFKPFDAAPSTYTTSLVQPFDFTIHIKNRTLTTSQYGIEVFNNASSDDAPEPTDIINVGCSQLGGGAQCTPATISHLDPTEWAFGIAMFGESTVLDGADIPSSPLVWQQLLSDNTMLVSYKHPVAGWRYGFLASVQMIQTVPEPPFSVPLAFGFFVLVATHRAFKIHGSSTVRG
jgi:hypothetical protein